MWKDMTDDVEEMLIGHEVGHALYTTTEHMEATDFRSIQGYMNVVEDVRIEKKIKNKYPGLRKAFITGYKELNEKDFFGVQGKDLSNLILIDRINLYYKCGINCGVKFTPAEMFYVRRVDRCDTMNDVYLLAQEIYAFSKEERDTKREELKKLQELLGEDPPEETDEIDNYMDDPDDFDNYSPEEEVENEETEATKRSSTSQTDEEKKVEEEKELESTTQAAFKQRLDELADTDTIVQNFIPKIELWHDPIVSTKTILSELKTDLAQTKIYRAQNYSQEWVNEYYGQRKNSLTKFKTESMRVVNYLVKEFEMRKSATEYKRITTAKSGDLDMRKLYAHTLTDDIFKKLDIIPEDKNHGMIFLLDWSGSMASNMGDTIKQVINLAMFCQRIQIPYQVFAFTTGRSVESIPYDVRSAQIESLNQNLSGFADGNWNLLEFFNHKMTNSEFNAMVEYLYLEPWQYSRQYDLNSTPLNESLLFMIDYIGKFNKQHAVEKMSFITLTDGAGHSVSGATRSVRSYGYNNDNKQCRVKNYVRDPITKKEYPLTDNGSEQSRVFLRIIKDRYNIKTVGFHVVSNSRRDIGCFIRDNLPKENTTSEYWMTEQIRKDIRQNDYCVVQNTGRDEMYLLPASKQKIEEGELEIDSKANAKSIAKQFSKYLGVKKSSRVVLSRFVSLVA
jgi:anti-sigma28 factor (negative regulator of flagellin synthesis)